MPKTSSDRRWTFARLKESPERVLAIGALALCLTCAVGGGGSRPDILSLVYVRIVTAWVLSFAVVLSWRRWSVSPVRPLLLLLAALAAWMVLQLVPLPPGLWQLMPGHDRYAAVGAILGNAPWRPISLVPRLTWNSLMALGPPAALLMTLSTQPARRVDLTIALWLAICLASALLGILQMVSSDTSPLYLYSLSSRGYAAGLFANRNHQAVFLAAALPILAIWASERGDRMTPAIQAVASSFAAILLVIGILGTGSRAGLLLTGLSISAFAAILSYRLGHNIRRRTRVWIGAALLVFLAVLIAIAVLSGRGLAVTRAVEAEDYVGELRFVHAPLVLSMARMFFPFGTGFGSFDPVFRGFEPDDTLGPTFFNHAHNDYLELALTGGLPAMLIAAVFLIWWVRRSLAAWRVKSSVGAAGSTIILFILLSSLVDYPVRTPLIATLAATACWWLAIGGPDSKRGRYGSGNSALRPLDRRLSGHVRRDAGTTNRASI